MSLPTEWIFIRGLARESGHWGSFVNEFQAALPGSRVHCLDLPGTGTRLNERSPLTVPEIAEAVRYDYLNRVLRGEIHPQAPKFLLSISLGSMVAASWLTRFTEDFTGGVLINTSTANLSPPWKRIRPPVLKTFTQIARSKDPIERERHVLSFNLNRKDLIERLALEWADLHTARPIRPETIARQLAAATRFELPRQVPRVPVLMLRSLGDKMVDPSCSAAIAARWNLPMRDHLTAGHDLPMEDGPWVTAQLKDWISATVRA